MNNLNYIKLNPQYTVRNEPNCSYLVKKNIIIDKLIGVESSSTTVIHPFIGYLLSTIGKFSLSDALVSISTELGLNVESVKRFVNKFIENEHPIEMGMGNNKFRLPKRLLIRSKSKDEQEYRTVGKYSCSDEFKPHRPLTPININLMATSRCTTNCIYCYADRNNKNDLKTKDILNVITNAYNTGVINLTITGGDILAHPDWKTILQSVTSYHFNPFISTKTPISESEVCFLSSIGIKTIQFSLDTVDVDKLRSLINVKSDYLTKVNTFFSACNKNHININVRTVLTKVNSDIADINALYSFINKFEVVNQWVLTPAFYSAYKTDYESYSISNDDLKQIYIFTNSLNARFPIQYNKINKTGYTALKFTSLDSFIKNNQTCYANSFSMSILSSGICTVCEMLYDNVNFIMGNVLDSKIENIWNSDKALNLYSKQQKTIFDQNTPCVNCSVYDICKNQLAKKVCYVDICKVYGSNRPDCPDPRCPESFIDTQVIL